MDKVWRTRDGETIRVEDMTTRHIRNCMRLFSENDPKYIMFEEELERRGALDYRDTTYVKLTDVMRAIKEAESELMDENGVDMETSERIRQFISNLSTIEVSRQNDNSFVETYTGIRW